MTSHTMLLSAYLVLGLGLSQHQSDLSKTGAGSNRSTLQQKIRSEAAIHGHGMSLQVSAWPKFHGDSRNTGQSSYGGSNGSLRWKYGLGSGVKMLANPAIGSDGTVYTVSLASRISYLTALTPGTSSASLSWRFSTAASGISSSPVIDSTGNVYFGCADKNLYSVSAGVLNWKYTTGGTIVASPALASDGTVYVASQDNYLYALTPGTTSATLKWKFLTGGFLNSTAYPAGSPAIASDGTIYVGSTDGYVYALNPSDGSVKWKYLTGGQVNSSPSIAADGTVYVGSNDNYLYALNPSDGSVRWSYLTGGAVYSTPAIALDGTIYVGSNDKNLYALVPGSSSCTVKWSHTFVGQMTCSPAIASDGTIYVMTNCYSVGGGDHILYALNSSDGSIAWNYTLGNTNVTSPAIGPDGTVYAESYDNSLYAIGTQVNTTSVSSLSITPSTVNGGDTATGTVNLASAAPSGGDVVTLLSSDPSVKVPPFITVAGGQTSATFSATTSTVNSNTTVTLTASSGGTNSTTTLVVQAPVPMALTDLSLSPDTITGGVTTSTGTVTLNQAAPSGGTVITLTNQWPGYVTVPATVTVPTGSTSANFSVSTPQMWPIQFTNDITASLGANSFTKTLTVGTTALQSVTITPSGIGSGGTATGTLTLGGPAPSGGWTVTLVSSKPYFISVPSTITVAAGATTATFTISTRSDTPAGSYLVSAHDSVIYRSGNFSVTNCPLSTISVSPTSVAAGTTATGTLTLSNPAPSSGWIVNLSSGVPSELGVPATVTVPAGATSVTFPVTTRVTSRTLSIGIYAIDSANSYKTTSLEVVGDQITGLSLNPATIGGNGSATGTITLAAPAGTGGWTVNLSAGVPNAVSIPSTVTVPAGASSVTFSVNGRQSNRNYTLGIYASDGNSGQSATLSVLGNSITSVSLSPNTVKAGNSSTGTVTLTSPAPIGGWVVTLKAGAAGSVNPPASVTVPAGATSANFTVTTLRGLPSLTSVIYASDGGSVQSTYLTVNH